MIINNCVKSKNVDFEAKLPDYNKIKAGNAMLIINSYFDENVGDTIFKICENINNGNVQHNKGDILIKDNKTFIMKFENDDGLHVISIAEYKQWEETVTSVFYTVHGNTRNADDMFKKITDGLTQNRSVL